MIWSVFNTKEEDTFKIDKNELSTIKEQFKDVIRYSQGIENPMVDDLFENWLSAKNWFIQRMGGLIYEVPEEIEIPYSPENQAEQLDSLINYIYYYQNRELADFIADNAESFYDNKVSHSNLKEIPIGMKLLKAFKYFETNETLLRQFQDKASQLIQAAKIKGKLCFSVHPLDFLSVSVNAHNWRSCHSLDGDYRSGNLNYMVDESTIICYIKHNDDCILPLFPDDIKWNSKLWRMLIYFNKDKSLVLAGKQYPFTSQEMMDIYLWDKLEEIFLPNIMSWRWNIWESDFAETKQKVSKKYIANGSELTLFNDLVVDGENTHHFNDLLHSSSYIPKYSKDRYTTVKSPAEIGKAVKCLCCEKAEVDAGFRMMCEKCDGIYGTEINNDYVECASCGVRIHIDEAYEVGEYRDEYVCDMCADSECIICEACGMRVFKSHAHYDVETNTSFCLDCWEE